MIVPDRAISGSVSRSWSFVSSAYTGGTDKKSIAAGRGWFAQPFMFAMFEWNERDKLHRVCAGRRPSGFAPTLAMTPLSFEVRERHWVGRQSCLWSHRRKVSAP
jgi:hypothetical protein